MYLAKTGYISLNIARAAVPPPVHREPTDSPRAYQHGHCARPSDAPPADPPQPPKREQRLRPPCRRHRRNAALSQSRQRNCAPPGRDACEAGWNSPCGLFGVIAAATLRMRARCIMGARDAVERNAASPAAHRCRRAQRVEGLLSARCQRLVAEWRGPRAVQSGHRKKAERQRRSAHRSEHAVDQRGREIHRRGELVRAASSASSVQNL